MRKKARTQRHQGDGEVAATIEIYHSFKAQGRKVLDYISPQSDARELFKGKTAIPDAGLPTHLPQAAYDLGHLRNLHLP